MPGSYVPCPSENLAIVEIGTKYYFHAVNNGNYNFSD